MVSKGCMLYQTALVHVELGADDGAEPPPNCEAAFRQDKAHSDIYFGTGR